VSEIALVQAAQQLVQKTPERLADFHKTMLGATATFGTAIASLAPTLFLGKEAKVPLPDGWALLLAPLLMLMSTLVFATGYLPRRAQLDLGDSTQLAVELERQAKIGRWLAVAGLFLFAVAVLAAVSVTLWIRGKY